MRQVLSVYLVLKNNTYRKLEIRKEGYPLKHRLTSKIMIGISAFVLISLIPSSLVIMQHVTA